MTDNIERMRFWWQEMNRLPHANLAARVDAAELALLSIVRHIEAQNPPIHLAGGLNYPAPDLQNPPAETQQEGLKYFNALESDLAALRQQLADAEALIRDLLPHVSLAILPSSLDARLVQFIDALSAPASDTGSEEKNDVD